MTTEPATEELLKQTAELEARVDDLEDEIDDLKGELAASLDWTGHAELVDAMVMAAIESRWGVIAYNLARHLSGYRLRDLAAATCLVAGRYAEAKP